MRRASRAAAPLVLLALAAAGCGFGEQLTKRGFVQEGDAICGETLLRAGLVLERSRRQGQPTSIADSIETLAAAYRDAASNLSRLELGDGDAALRDDMVSEFRATAGALRAAAEQAAAGNPGAQGAASSAVAELAPLSRELRDYGFEVCGGRAPATASASSAPAT